MDVTLPCSFHSRDSPGDVMVCQLAQWPHHWVTVLDLNRFLRDAFMSLPCLSGECRLWSPSPSTKRFSTSCCCVVQSLSSVQLYVAPWTAAHHTPLSSTVSQSLLKFMSTESVMLSYHLIISSSVTPFSSCPQFFPASGSFPMGWFFASGGQSIV